MAVEVGLLVLANIVDQMTHACSLVSFSYSNSIPFIAWI